MVPPKRRSTASALWRLIRECVSRAGIVATFVTLAVGGLAGYFVGQNVKLTDVFWQNAAIFTVAGIVLGFVFDLLFISPTRLWRDAELSQSIADQAAAQAADRAATAAADVASERQRADRLQEQLNQVLVDSTGAYLRQLPRISDQTEPPPQPIERQTEPPPASAPAQPYSAFTRTFTIPAEPPTHLIVRQEGVNTECRCGWIGLSAQYENHRRGVFSLYSDTGS